MPKHTIQHTKTRHNFLLNPTELRYIADKGEGAPLKRGISASQIKASLNEKATNLPQLITNIMFDFEILEDYAKRNNLEYFDMGRGEKIKASESSMLIEILEHAFLQIILDLNINNDKLNELLDKFNEMFVCRESINHEILIKAREQQKIRASKKS